METQDQIVHTIHKGPKEEVRLSLRRYKDRGYLDIRVWFQPPKGGEYHPTTKGITLGLEFIPELKRGLERADRESLEMARHSNLSSVK